MLGIGAIEIVIILGLCLIPFLMLAASAAPAARRSTSPAPTGEVDVVRELSRTRDAWRDGGMLVVRSGATLPDRCISTNAPAAGRLRYKLFWHPPALYLAIFGGLWLYVLLALLMRQRVDVEVGVSQEVLAKRKTAFWSSLTLAAVGVVFLLSTTVGGVDPMPSLGAFMLVAAPLIWIFGSRLIGVVRIEGGYAWIRGANPDFLMGLPSWQERQRVQSFA